MTNKTRKWIRAGLETLIHGGAAAVASSFAAASIDPKDWGWFSPNFFKLAGATFMSNGGLRFIQWWAANPLPPDEESNPVRLDGNLVVPEKQISLNPVNPVQSIENNKTS